MITLIIRAMILIAPVLHYITTPHLIYVPITMTFTPGDRKVVLCLIILIAAYIGYASIHRPASSSADDEQIQSSTADSSSMVVSTSELTTGSQIASGAPAHSDSLLPARTSRYPGPPQRDQYPKVNKLRPGQTIDLNSADTLQLQMVPGVGPAYARRIYKRRLQLGGYYVVEQLQEVYGMDRERYSAIAPYFVIQTPVQPILLSYDTISYHPYLQWRHRKELQKQIQRGDSITWRGLMESGVFSTDDSLRLSPYMPL